MKDTVKAVLASYGRTAATAVIAVYVAMEGRLDRQALEAYLFAFIVSTVAPALRALNPHDTAFGKLQAPEHFEEH
jgi:hypothetical protein